MYVGAGGWSGVAGGHSELGGAGEALLGEKEQIANFASTFEFAALI